MADSTAGPGAVAEPVELMDARDDVHSGSPAPDEDSRMDDVMKTSETPIGVETPSHDSVNGNGLNGHHIDDAEDDINNEELTPPPDTPPSISQASISPIDEPVSRTPSLPANVLVDEIVVGTNAKHLIKKDVQRISETDDVDMDDVEDESVASLKRKRISNYSNTAEDEFHSPAPRSELPESRPRPVRPAKTHGVGGVKGTLLGYWRDSEPEDIKDKHAVIGFIDIRDRLRTRIQPTTRDGRNIIHEYPLPPGPGGSWVTFQQVAFEPHLCFLNQHQVKEYVKIRVENQKHETPEERAAAESAAVKEAIRRIQENPPPPAASEPLVAYGTDIPEHANIQSRPEAKKRRPNNYASYNASNAGSPSVNQPQQLDSLPGTRPTRILLGYWKHSDSEELVDKHAVYGILGANDMFRVKLMRETRDGRTIVGNFPLGAGALWIHWDEVEFESHLRSLTRPEIKEYCRVRQRQLDDGEEPVQRAANETKAVYEAQKRVASGYTTAPAKREEYPTAPVALAMKTPATNGNGYEDIRQEQGLATPDGPSQIEPRQSRQTTQPTRARHSLPDVELRAANRPPGPSALERTNSIARREIAKVEAAALRAEQRAQTRESYGTATAVSNVPSATSSTNKTMFHDNVSRLNKVWAAQEANRLKAGAEDAKIYMGIKYERKQNGPFEGKLVSQGTIISIDGEDYVEYRVLTKPSFF